MKVNRLEKICIPLFAGMVLSTAALAHPTDESPVGQLPENSTLTFTQDLNLLPTAPGAGWSEDYATAIRGGATSAVQCWLTYKKEDASDRVIEAGSKLQIDKIIGPSDDDLIHSSSDYYSSIGKYETYRYLFKDTQTIDSLTCVYAVGWNSRDLNFQPIETIGSFKKALAPMFKLDMGPPIPVTP